MRNGWERRGVDRPTGQLLKLSRPQMGERWLDSGSISKVGPMELVELDADVRMRRNPKITPSFFETNSFIATNICV